jgi:hypothetical protein
MYSSKCCAGPKGLLKTLFVSLILKFGIFFCSFLAIKHFYEKASNILYFVYMYKNMKYTYVRKMHMYYSFRAVLCDCTVQT